MFNIFLFLTEHNVEVIDLQETLQNLPIFPILLVAYGIGVIGFILKRQFVELIPYTLVCGFAIFMVVEYEKLIELGDVEFEILKGLLNSIFKAKKSLPHNTGTELLIGFNLFAKLNPDPKNIEEADNNRKQLQKNVVKKQNKNQKKIVKKGWI
jgi:hypothetical protein